MHRHHLPARCSRKTAHLRVLLVVLGTRSMMPHTSHRREKTCMPVVATGARTSPTMLCRISSTAAVWVTCEAFSLALGAASPPPGHSAIFVKCPCLERQLEAHVGRLQSLCVRGGLLKSQVEAVSPRRSEHGIVGN